MQTTLRHSVTKAQPRESDVFMKIEKVQGANVPALGFGTFRMKEAECTQAVENALKIGYRHLDTTEIYESEKAVGDGIRAGGIARSELFITIKA